MRDCGAETTSKSPPVQRLAVAAAAAWSAFVGACIPSPNFDDRELVQTPRILAVVAEPPEIGPGQQSLLTPLLADPRGDGRPLRLRWRACVTGDSLGGGGGGGFGGGQYGMPDPPPGCSDPRASVDLGDGDTAVLVAPDEATLAPLFAQFEALATGALPPGFARRVFEEVGIPVTVELVVSTPDAAGGETVLVTGFKRVLVSGRGRRGTNPPRPRVIVGELGVLSARGPGASGFDCASEDGAPLVVPAGAPITLRPDPTPDDPDDDPATAEEPWARDRDCADDDPVTECYGVLDPQGGFLLRPEGAYYSWFTTGGTFRESITDRGRRDNEWTPPAAPGDVTLWIVVRDGHGGTSACRAMVTVR
jgi:hypothetical protein